VVIDGVDRVGDIDRECVPASLRRVFGIEIVLAIIAGTHPVFNNVLFGMADNDSEISIFLDTFFGDSFDGARGARPVDGDDTIDYGGSEFPRIGKRISPLVHAVHAY
jgi:hypothetical protein